MYSYDRLIDDIEKLMQRNRAKMNSKDSDYVKAYLQGKEDAFLLINNHIQRIKND